MPDSFRSIAVAYLNVYCLGLVFQFGYRIVWWNMVFGFAGGLLITWIHYLRGTWKAKALV